MNGTSTSRDATASASSWEDLVTTALLGTDRRPVATGAAEASGASSLPTSMKKGSSRSPA
ncbi:hypothetical protein AB0N17_30945 [Streptomyces sp. NPDC051133]|uniref:hypothetical protein n=1 Tax=Streptomyces sp. NPDC051133 TaxID=3155521 RepID=UPI0034419816